MNNNSLQQKVMDAIRDGKVKMRPRWHFVALSVLVASAVVLLGLFLAYTFGFIMFLMRESGAWFAPSIGGRGWLIFFHSVPWLFVLVFALFIIVLEFLARRYEFVYQRPLLVSLLGVTALIVAGGFLAEPLHRTLGRYARHDLLPPPLDALYRPAFHAGDASVVRGIIVSGDRHVFVIERDDGTSTIIVTPRTRLPYGADFESGDTVVVIGDRSATGSIEAFGIREIDGENN